MRDVTSWMNDLAATLGDATSAIEPMMPEEEFFRIELGLCFLADHYPGEPIGVLPPILSGYVQPLAGLEPVVRRLRHRMADMARTGYWRHHLDTYVRIKVEVRGFDRTDSGDRIVTDKTVFAQRPSAVCADRYDAYRDALSTPVPYLDAGAYPPAEAGKTYQFLTSSGEELVRFPDRLPDRSGPVPRLESVTQRTREPWTISWSKDLTPTAEWMDQVDPAVVHGGSRPWRDRVGTIRFNLVDAEAGVLVDGPDTFPIDGTNTHLGLMNSGKTTMLDVLTVDRVIHHDNRVAHIVPATADSLAKVSLFGRLGISAVPLIGQSNRAEHIARYWRSVFQESDTLFPDTAPPDPAAVYGSATCLLEPLRITSHRERKALSPAEFPCRGGQLKAVDGRPFRHDCPLVDVCPFQKASQDVASAKVWVTTSAALVASHAEPGEVKRRWAEELSHNVDLVIGDEADKTYTDLDDRFTQTELLVGRGTDGPGWTHRTVIATNEGLAAQQMQPIAIVNVQKWVEYLNIHERAVTRLYTMLLDSHNEFFKNTIEHSPFSGHTLLRRVALMIHGVTGSPDDDKHLVDQADDFFKKHLHALANEPFEVTDALILRLVDAMIAEQPEPARIDAAIDAWLDANIPSTTDRAGTDMPMLRLTLQAGIWAGRITTTFFKMSTMYPSVRDALRMPDPDSFWMGRPPRDYQALVPEAPMGNMMALLWKSDNNGGGKLQIVWIHGVGRWLLHHLHDLLAPEGIDGPHVILTSATCWLPESSMYHIPILPTAVLTQQDDDLEALKKSIATIQLAKPGGRGEFISGRYGDDRVQALHRQVSYLATPRPGRSASMLADLIATLPDQRKQVLLVVLSGREAKIVAEHINSDTPYQARHLVPDAHSPGDYGLQRRLVKGFGDTGADFLVAAELAIERGYNILNKHNTAALGAVVFLVRSHPPPDDLTFPLSLVNQRAMERLLHPVQPDTSVFDTTRNLRQAAQADWYSIMGQTFYFRSLPAKYRPAFVANRLAPNSQTIGRSIRGNSPTRVWFSDAAFAPRLATGDAVADTERTSLIVATQEFLDQMLTPPAELFGRARAEYTVSEAVWGLMHHLYATIEIGST